MIFVTAQDPTKRAAKQYNKKTTPNLTTTTTNNTTVITPNDTELDHNPEDYKSNHNKWCPEYFEIAIFKNALFSNSSPKQALNSISALSYYPSRCHEVLIGK